MLSQLVLFAGLCLTANAFVNYGDAALYDEFDLSLYKSFPLAECLAASCKVYVSAPESSLPTLEKVYLGDTTLAALARESNATTGLKTPYNLRAYSGKNFITNLNFKFATAPVAVYIVYQRAAFYSTALVYEPSSAPLPVLWTNSSTITLLSATNFTVQGAVKQGSLARGRVLAGGYDVATKSFVKTPALYEFSIDKSFSFSVYGPLATLYSSQSVEVELTIQKGVQDNTSPRTFFTSAGYTGAISGQVYRSSLYSKTVQYKISYEKATKVHFKAYLNTFADSVEVSVDGETTSLRGTLGLTSYLQRFSASGKDIVITFSKSSDYTSFLLRVASEIVLDQVKEKVDEKVEEIKEKVADKVAEAKEALKEKVEEIKDEFKEKIQEKVDEKVDEAKEALQEKVEKEVEEKKEEIESKIEDAAEKLKEALSKATAKPDSAEVDEIKDVLKEKIGEQVEEKAEEVEEKIEEAQEKIEEAKEEVQDKIDFLRNKVTALPDSSEIKDALKKKLEDRIGKVTGRPNRGRA